MKKALFFACGVLLFCSSALIFPINAQKKFIGEEKLYYGVAYYPEALNFETVDQDIELMKQANINVVRMGEFSWNLMEPKEGAYDFDWLHRLIDKLSAAGIDVIMGTPSATPPIWLATKHPEIFIQEENGQLKTHGARRSVKYNSPIYNEYCRKVCEALAKSIGTKKGVIGWQTDNEFGLHDDFSELTRNDWHVWLEERYGTIENLNKLWATNLWAQEYHEFGQIPMAGKHLWHHPSLRMDWKKFMSDQVVSFQAIQLEAIRKHSSLPITHDGMPGSGIEYPDLFEDLDFMATNFYHNFSAYNRVQINFDRLRGYDKGLYWVFETAPNYSGGGSKGMNWYIHQPEGALRAILWAHYALGGQGTMFWLWRQHPAGHEMPHGSFISSWGKPVANFEQLSQLGGELKKHSPILMETEVVKPEIGFVYSHKSVRGYKIEMNSADNIKYYNDVTSKFYRPLSDAFLPRDVIHENVNIDNYKLIVAPMVPSLKESFKAKLKPWVENGGVLIIGPMTGFRSEYWASFPEHALGEFGKWSGIEVETRVPVDQYNKKHDAVPQIKSILGGGSIGDISLWSEALSSANGETLATYMNGIHDGEPGIIENKVGKGKVVYLGTDPGDAIMQQLYLRYAQELGIDTLAEGDKDVVIVERMKGKEKFCFVINLTNEKKSVTLKENIKETLIGEKIEGNKLELAPFEVRFSKMK